MKQRSEVDLVFCKRYDKKNEFYFEVWVRSVNRPDVRRGTIIERDRDERRNIGIAAAALAEDLCEAYGDNRDPATAWDVAQSTYDRLIMNNPIPKLGGEQKLV